MIEQSSSTKHVHASTFGWYHRQVAGSVHGQEASNVIAGPQLRQVDVRVEDDHVRRIAQKGAQPENTMSLQSLLRLVYTGLIEEDPWAAEPRKMPEVVPVLVVVEPVLAERVLVVELVGVVLMERVRVVVEPVLDELVLVIVKPVLVEPVVVVVEPPSAS